MSKKTIIGGLSIVFLAVAMTGCGANVESELGNSQTNSTLSSEHQEVEAHLPPVVFIKYVSYSEEDAPDGSVSFFADDGGCYISNDGTLSEMYPNEVAEEFGNGTLQNYVTLHTQCEPNELKEEYLKVSNVIKSGGFQITDPSEGPDVQADTTIWYGMYCDENGEIQYRPIHITNAIGEHFSDNDDLNEVYAWLLEHEKRDNSAVD